MDHLQVGDVLEGRYRIDQPIARGGMSAVYRCVDLRLSRAVAVKVMDHRYAGDPVFRQRFQREALAMAQLNHPNLVGVLDFSSDEDDLFLVMELITGGTLRELLAERGPMPPYAAAAVMRAVLTGLAAAHRAGMVHRDIKPDNVLINSDHTVKLADFGLVRAADATSGNKQIVGTATYLSPEQVSADPIGPASDVYSAGIVLFELLTGEPPFTQENSLDRAYQRLNEDVPAPSSRIDGVPPLMDALVAEATARNPEERFTDAGEFFSALNDVSEELSLESYTVPAPENSAANRVAAIPPDVHDLDSPLAATGFIDPADATHMEAQAGAPAPDETAVVPSDAQAAPPVPYQQSSPPPAPQQPVPAKAEPEVSNRSSMGLALWTILVLLVLGAVAIGAWWLGSGRYGEVPQVLGLDQEQATAAISHAGFSPEVREVFSDTPRETIVGTDPGKGDRLLRGKNVALLISKGKPTVPDIPEGTDLDSYRELLDERSLTYEQGSLVFSDSVDEGLVAEVSPSPGTEVKLGTKVKVSLSKGPAPVEIPEVRGMSEDEARNELAKVGLKVGKVTKEFDKEIDGGKAIRTWPLPGSKLNRGDEVELRISSAVTIPDLEGLTEDEARKTLENLHLKVGKVSTDDGYGGSTGEEIARSNPAAGERVDPDGETVDLVKVGNAKVPNLIGKRVSEARSLVQERGFMLDSGNASDDAYVITQSPMPGKFLKPGQRVKVNTAKLPSTSDN